MNKRKLSSTQSEPQQHFGFRKLSAGLASVLLGTSIYLMSSNNTQLAKADTIPDDPQESQVESKSGTENDSSKDFMKSVADTSKPVSENTQVDQIPNVSTNKPDNTTITENQTGDASSNTSDTSNITNEPSSTNQTTVPNKPTTSQTTAKTTLANPPVTRIARNGLTGEYDQATGTLTISGTATLSAKTPFFGFTEYQTTAKHLKIMNKIILQNDAAVCLFKGTNLEDITGLENLDTSQATSMQEMFSTCKKLTSLDLSKLNTSKVQSMLAMFNDCSFLTSLNLTNCDTSNVTNMIGIFSGCSKLTDLAISTLNTSKVQNMSDMFYSCQSLKKIDLTNWDTSNVTNMSGMFSHCLKLTDLAINTLNTSKVQNMSSMFYGCESLTKIDLTNLDTSNVTDMSNMFEDCSSATDFVLNTLDTSQVKNMSDMFESCTSVVKLDLHTFKTGNVTNMMRMFGSCEKLTDLNLTNFDTHNVTNMSYMFWYCESMSTFDVSMFDTTQVKTMALMFAGCYNLLRVNMSSFNTTNATTLNGMFEWDRSLSELDLSNFNMGPTTDIKNLVWGCDSLRVLKLGPKSRLASDSGLGNDGFWFKQGTGTLTNPQDKQGRMSKVLQSSYNPTTESDTYIRGYKYTVHFYDKDNANQELSASIPMTICLTSYPEGQDVGKGLAIQPPAEITTAIATLKGKNYRVDKNPFDPAFTPTLTDTDVSIYFTHNTKDETETIKRKLIVHYQDKNNQTLAPDTVQEKTFTRAKTTDLVTNTVKYSDWTIDDASTTEVKVPVIKGYLTDKATIPSQTITFDKDVELTQIYQKLGQIIPIDSKGNAIASAIAKTYENDPDDPTKIKASQSLPAVDGYIPTKDQITPDDPFGNTKVTYLAKNQTTIGFIDQDDDNQAISGIDQIVSSNTIGQNIDKPATIAQILADLTAKGYELVKDPFAEGIVATEGNQSISYIFKHKIEDVSETVTRTATVYYTNASELGIGYPHHELGSFTFTHSGTKDLVTGKVTWIGWSDNQKTQSMKNPVIPGYITDKTDLEEQTVTPYKDLNVFVTYRRVGNYILIDKNGNAIPGKNKIPYANDPNDPTKIKSEFPEVDGYTPSKDATLPTSLTKDTTITYLENNQTIIGFIDQDDSNKAIHDAVIDSTAIGNTITPSTSVNQILADLAAKGYELVSDPFKNPVTATDGKQTLNYVFKHKKDDSVTDTVTRKQIIHFVNANGNKLADDKVTEATFTRTGVKDLVTGNITWSNWSKAQTLTEIKVPVIKGYIADKATIPAQTIDNTKDLESTVTYKAVGGFIPVDKNGNAIPGTSKTPYENDPNDATKIKPTLPNVDGHVPSTGTIVPTDPTKDTTVTYWENNQTVIGFIDQDDENKSIYDSITSSNIIGQPINKPTNISQILADLLAKGYELVSDPFKNPVTATDGKQTLNYVFKHKQDNSVTDTVTRKQIIHFVDASGNKLADDKVTEATFTRTGVKDVVTGKITWGNWSASQTMSEVKVPVVKGYIADKATVPAQTIDNTKDIESTVTYQKLGGFIPVDKNGKTIPGTNKVPYENDPNDATKVKPTLPKVDGYVPGKGTTVPDDPTKDTTVTYLENNQTIIGFVDQDNNNQAISGVENITSSNEIGKPIAKPANIDQIIADLAAKGYELVSDPFKNPVTATDGKQTLNYVFKHKQDNTLTDTIKRKQTVHFVDVNGNKLADDKVTEATFTRTGVKDLATGKITWSDWSKTQSLAEVKVPVIKGYIADQGTIPAQTIDSTKDIESTVTYQKLGGYIPTDKNGNVLPGTDKIPYENDPNDASKVNANQKLPSINGRQTPTITVPSDPTKDTKVIYEGVKTGFKVIVHDDTLKQDLTDYLWEDKDAHVGDKVKYDWAKVKKDLLAHGYIIAQEPNIPDVYGADAQTITIHVTHKTVTLDPDNPPAENSTVNDSGTKWPDPSEYIQVYEQRIQFVDENGKVLSADNVQKIKFTRKLLVDSVTGKVLNPDAAWVQVDKNYQAVKLPTIAGYEPLAKSKNGIKLDNGTYPSTKATSANVTDSIIYKRIATGGGTDNGNDHSAPVPTKPSPDDVPDGPTEPTTLPVPTKPKKPKQPHVLVHKHKNSQQSNKTNTNNAHKTNMTISDPVSANQASNVKANTQNVLPQTGSSQADNQNPLAVIALGFALMSLGITVKPKKRYE